jgi:MerR family transcriptional regulator, copper efflux regulator
MLGKSMVLELQESLKIGELSTQSGVPIKTIRYYAELGLVKAVGRTDGHFRLFDRSAVNRLLFIKRLQSLGLSLKEIEVSLSIYDSGDLPCQDIQAKLEQHVSEIDRQMAELSLLRQELAGILQSWSASPAPQPGEICPNLHI